MLNKQNGHAYEMTDQMLMELLCRFAGDCLATMAAQEEADAAKAEKSPAPEKA